MTGKGSTIYKRYTAEEVRKGHGVELIMSREPLVCMGFQFRYCTPFILNKSVLTFITKEFLSI